MTTIQVDISKSFKNLSLSFRFAVDNNRVVLFGPSGSGKSVLLKMIAGFFDPDEGEIRISDRIFYDRNNHINVPTYHRNIGFLPQEYTLFPNMTVEQNITYGLRTRKLPVEQSSFDRLIERFELGSKLSSYPRDLSGGQQQRAALARILLIRPYLLLLDEPFSALDSSIRESLRDLVMEIADEMEINVLFVTHDIEEAFVFSKEAIVILNGKVLEFGLRVQIFDRPKYVETARLVGFENIWPLKSAEAEKLYTENELALSYKGPVVQNARFLCIRPESIMILRDDQPYKKNLKENILNGLVTRIHDRGRYVRVLVKAENRFDVAVNIPSHAFSKLGLVIGKWIKVSLKEESIVLCKTYHSY